METERSITEALHRGPKNLATLLNAATRCWELRQLDRTPTQLNYTHCGAVHDALRSDVAVTTCRHLSIPVITIIIHIIISVIT